MTTTRAWAVGDLCTEPAAHLGLTSTLRILDVNPRARGGGYDQPWYDGRVEVAVGHFTAGRVGGFTEIYRGYFPLAANLTPYEETP